MVDHRLKVLVCTQMFPKSQNEPLISGMVKNPYYQTLALAEAGVCIEVITTGEKKWRTQVSNIPITSIGDAPLKGIFKAFLYEIKMTLECLKSSRHFKPDLIHIHHLNLPLLVLMKRLRIIKAKLIYTAHGTSTPELNAAAQGSRFKYMLLKINGYFQHKIDSFCWRQADHIFSPSEYQIREMDELYGIHPSKIDVVYNGFDNKNYYSSEELRTKFRKKLSILPEQKALLFVGRAAKKKGVDYLIEAVDKLFTQDNSIRLIIVLGYTGRQKEYRDLIKKMALERKYILYLESVPEGEMGGVYNAADLCIFPSIGYESIPTVIYEAMACAKPIVTQGSWGVKEVLNETFISESEILSASFSPLLESFLSNRQKLVVQGKTNQHAIIPFSWQSGGQKLKTLYQNISRK